jgi:hypothetical protein
MNTEKNTPSAGADSDKKFAIIVNTRPKTATQDPLPFDEVLVLAYGVVPDYEKFAYTVNYSRGPERNPKGSMVRGESVYLKDGMVFDAIRTDKS